jgi:hypothetical protein
MPGAAAMAAGVAGSLWLARLVQASRNVIIKNENKSERLVGNIRFIALKFN